MALQIAANGRIFGRMVFDLLGWLRPLKGQVYDAAGLFDGLQSIQSCSQNSHLAGRIAWLAQGSAKRVFDRSHARHANRTGQVGNRRQANGCKAGRFDLTLYQSNGPAADRSDRHQDDDVDPILSLIHI